MKISDYIGEATVYDKKLMLERKDPSTETTTAPTTATTTAPTTADVIGNDDKTDAERLGKVAVKIYRMILSNNRITAGALAARMKLSVNGVRYHLKRIKSAGLIRYVGNSQSDGHWEVVQ